ncbi:hypothetical protein [Alteromonas sp. a30]|uniref:hypothetical protein n=1 Tax=Alteromonas sp. a30 TaxID=2730917 RepID=UPI00227FBD01|nr:hypothetical protein [Alteromonas sp. a30]MCY7297262.1 prenyltransferase [Alteromonas sp. a30]
MGLNTWLTLGRASNLPSIWTNVFAAALVAQAGLRQGEHPSHLTSLADATLTWLNALVALSLMYLGGMFLNDAFDAKWDKQHQQPRPIAQGQVSAFWVWVHGLSMLMLGTYLIGAFYAAQFHQASSSLTSDALVPSLLPLVGWGGAGLLATCIVLYNALHKRIQHGAVLMGLCRLGVYLLAALLIAQLTSALIAASIALCLYICGVTYAAKYEHQNRLQHTQATALLFLPICILSIHGYSYSYFWLYAAGFGAYLLINMKRHLKSEHPIVGAFIGSLLAAIPLFDGLVLASMNLIFPSLICLLVFSVMPKLQRWIRAT